MMVYLMEWFRKLCVFLMRQGIFSDLHVIIIKLVSVYAVHLGRGVVIKRIEYNIKSAQEKIIDFVTIRFLAARLATGK
jgi:hypothetical protein